MPVLRLPSPSTGVIPSSQATSGFEKVWRRALDQGHKVLVDSGLLTFYGIIFVLAVFVVIALMVWTPYYLKRELRRAAKADLERGETAVELQTIRLAYSERERQIVHVVQENDNLKREKGERMHKIDVLEREKGELAQENVVLKRRNGELEADLEKAKRQQDNADALQTQQQKVLNASSDLLRKVSELETEVEALKSDQLERAEAVSSAEVERLQSRVVLLEAQLAGAQELSDDTRDDLQGLSAAMNESIEEQQRDIRQLNAELQASFSRIARLARDGKEKSRQLADAGKAVTAAESFGDVYRRLAKWEQSVHAHFKREVAQRQGEALACFCRAFKRIGVEYEAFLRELFVAEQDGYRAFTAVSGFLDGRAEARRQAGTVHFSSKAWLDVNQTLRVRLEEICREAPKSLIDDLRQRCVMNMDILERMFSNALLSALGDIDMAHNERNWAIEAQAKANAEAEDRRNKDETAKDKLELVKLAFTEAWPPTDP
ncbi:hypothetical protein IE81DRAFT_254790 [Ceraceosorus guamensis]|uniref:Uncharacterized protein n=1 Tax=Ceraceosorus guamensis TaxID=1522189 RepID=A0A316W4Y0_9BASI|nr:hypothetical protein IE81DRAFT_254790 [Ceraceosorus guamensis]PWN44792.1 hypothetical protein IE81DRAFT_254790 [Ceraceosorus guamensis]